MALPALFCRTCHCGDPLLRVTHGPHDGASRQDSACWQPWLQIRWWWWHFLPRRVPLQRRCRLVLRGAVHSQLRQLRRRQRPAWAPARWRGGPGAPARQHVSGGRGLAGSRRTGLPPRTGDRSPPLRPEPVLLQMLQLLRERFLHVLYVVVPIPCCQLLGRLPLHGPAPVAFLLDQEPLRQMLVQPLPLVEEEIMIIIIISIFLYLVAFCLHRVHPRAALHQASAPGPARRPRPG
mmetsp:Transcript_71832/g.190567  ORF Transcript_71832/g.190567 Transcript_71832/m.190567 type:complete len:235 (-) Transcript_71832:236-940(-)